MVVAVVRVLVTHSTASPGGMETHGGSHARLKKGLRFCTAANPYLAEITEGPKYLNQSLWRSEVRRAEQPKPLLIGPPHLNPQPQCDLDQVNSRLEDTSFVLDMYIG